jgi:capsular exopolysaccharide synthesis family protein
VNLTDHFRLIWRRRWIILALSVLIAGAVFARNRTLSNVYESQATLDVLSGTPKAGQPVTQEEVNIRTGRYAGLAGATSVLTAASSNSGLGISVETARSRVSADVPTDRPGFITVRARGPSPSEAQDLAASVVDSLRATGENEQNPIQVVTPAAKPSGPIAPTPTRDAAFAFLIALVVNSELFALLGFVGGGLTRGRQSEEVARLTGVPVLALIPRRREEWVAEAFRTLRSAVDLARSDPPLRSIAVTGAEPGSGASFVAFGLAQATANLKMGVVLVDANLHRPVLASELHLPDQPGLVEMIREGAAEWLDLPRANPLQKRFRVVPAGEEVADPPGLLGSGALHKTLDQFHDADLVLVDSPAIDESIDALVIASQCDAAILVIDARRARRSVIENAVLRIGQANVEFLGTVVNRVEPDERTRPPRRRRSSMLRR